MRAVVEHEDRTRIATRMEKKRIVLFVDLDRLRVFMVLLLLMIGRTDGFELARVFMTLLFLKLEERMVWFGHICQSPFPGPPRLPGSLHEAGAQVFILMSI
jgi:hypothetical protein